MHLLFQSLYMTGIWIQFSRLSFQSFTRVKSSCHLVCALIWNKYCRRIHFQGHLNCWQNVLPYSSVINDAGVCGLSAGSSIINWRLILFLTAFLQSLVLPSKYGHLISPRLLSRSDLRS